MARVSFDQTVKVLSIAGALFSFLWGVWVWREKTQHEATTQRLEATKPFLEAQLKLYTEASQITAVISTSTNSDDVRKSIDRFWRLYWGELALVENRAVEGAMRAFGDALTELEQDSDRRQRLPYESLRVPSLNLAHACRASLDGSWGINAWTKDSTAEPVR